MSKFVKYALTGLAALAVLILLARLPLWLAGPKISWSPALKVDGTLYVSTGDPIKANIPEEEILGRTQTYTEDLPRRNGQTNIRSENGLPYALWEDGLTVEIDGEWMFFKKSENN